MGNARKDRLGATRVISRVLLALACAAVCYSVYQVAAGHAAFSWAWLVALLPALFGTYLLATCAVEGRRPRRVEATTEAEAAG